MSVSARQVKNKKDADGRSTGRSGTVYDVYIRYKTADGYKAYGKRGFLTKKEALDHEAEMRVKLTTPGFEPVKAADAKQTVQQYLEEWVEIHGKANLRPSTYTGYKCHIKNHIVPYVGQVPLNKVTPAMIDNMIKQLYDKGLSTSTCRYSQRILSVAFEAARKYRYIDTNGKYIAPRAPYGYRKSPDDCHKLLIDPEAAAIVRRIFVMAQEGTAITEIVRRLNQDGILLPSMYAKQNGPMRKSQNADGCWNTKTVKNILTNYTYTGNLTQGKNQVSSVNTHEPIITVEAFDAIQKKFSTAENRRKMEEPPNPLRGKVICEHCGGKM